MKVVITKMYTGRYLEKKIGHEVINTFKADNGKHYIYINAYGWINKEYQEADVVLLTRTISAHKLEVIGYAIGLKCCISSKVLNRNNTDNRNSEGLEEQKKQIKDDGITYGGVSLNMIFGDNSEDPEVLFMTYEVGEYHSVKKGERIYISDGIYEGNDSNKFHLADKTFSSSSLHMYLNKDNPKSIGVVEEMIKDSNLWEKEDTCRKVDVNKVFDTTLIDVIGQSYKELVFSNWLAYYLGNDSDFMKSFLNEVLNVPINDKKSLVTREYKHIDLFIETSNEIIVIENKLKSDINGNHVEHLDDVGDVDRNQLDKYVIVANNEKAEKEKTNESRFFILLPDYKYPGEMEFPCSSGNPSYKVIRYSVLSVFCEKTSVGEGLKYYDEFKLALRQHSTEYLDDLFPMMEQRFVSAIREKSVEL